MADAGLLVAEGERPGRRDRLSLDGEDGDRAPIAVGHERESALAVDRDSRRPLAGFELRDHGGRFGAQVDDREVVVGNRLRWIGGIDLLRGRHQRQPLVGRDGDAERRAHDTSRRLGLADHLGRRCLQVEDRHRVRFRIGDNLHHAVHEVDLVVVRGNRDLRGRRTDDEQDGKQRGRFESHADLLSGPRRIAKGS